MTLNFSDNVDLTDGQLDTAASAVKAWCQSLRVEPGSAFARWATRLAIDLLATRGEMTSAELVEILLARVPANAPDAGYIQC